MGISLNAGNWLTLAAVVAFGVFQVAHGFITRPQKEQRQEMVKEIHEHTVNTHDTNMRSDIDKIGTKVDLILDAVSDIRRKVSDHDTAIGELRGRTDRR